MRRTTTALISLLIALPGTVSVLGRAPAAAQSSVWTSTNGSIVFRSDRDGDPDVFAMDATGAGVQRLTRTSGVADEEPAWSPDGDRIAYVRRIGGRGRADLFVMTGAGRKRTRLTTTPLPERDPSWSPDGTRIVYSARTDRAGPFRLFVAKADGSARVQVTAQSRGSADRAPAWSPDGSRIAFVSDRAGGFPEIYLLRVDGSRRSRLTSNRFIDGNPSWSPDGTSLVVERCCPNGASRLVEIDVATGDETNLTSDPSFMDFDPSWSPDGTTIAFVSVRVGQGNVDVWTMRADGSGRQRLTNDPAPDLSPDWQPRPECTIAGSGGADADLRGTDGDDVICALGGDDRVRAGSGRDLVFGGRGDDDLEGQVGSDVVYGDAGNDRLSGGPDYDVLDGGGGTDTCVRGADGALRRRCER